MTVHVNLIQNGNKIVIICYVIIHISHVMVAVMYNPIEYGTGMGDFIMSSVF